MGAGNFVDLSFGRATPDYVLVCPQSDHTIRWRPGERLDHLFEDLCDRTRHSDVHRGRLAVDTDETVLTYDQLDALANQLARYLLARGARAGDRIGLLLDSAACSYVGMLAVLKINAAYVPLDAGFPPDRLSYIVGDAGVSIVLSRSRLRDCVGHLPATLLYLDEIAAQVAACDDHRLTAAEKGDPVDELAYIIYTSGSTGRPKGVAVEHASICNFVRVAVEVYGIQPSDRVYQGMTIAFDFSVEEIWVPLIAGATLVPKPGGTNLLGDELRDFLHDNKVTALCCVPTLLTTLDQDLPDLRFLLVSGEACPQDLISRWHRSDRRFLNVYGPTEATVTATWTVVHPDRPVTIGVPLPTYSTVILDPDNDTVLQRGAVGEIGIAGIGLARGYLNRDDLTDRAFIRDFVGIGNNPSGRIYRTGDLGRINDDGEIEYHGRIDTQVKIRGYRIELTEIESVLLQVPGIALAVVDTYEPEPGTVELVAYYTLRTDTAAVNQPQIYEYLRGRLPRYMVPAYLEELAVIPMLPSDKADRKNLPAPTTRRSVTTQSTYVAPTTDTERIFADVLASVLRLEQVSVDSHFFDDLGASSLLMAQFCARVRKHTDLPPVSMKDVYQYPTIRSLAATLQDVAPTAEPRLPVSRQPVTVAGTAQYVLCGVLQLLLFLGSVYVGALVLEAGFEWTFAGPGLIDTWQRSLVLSVVSFLVLCTLPILMKWVLVGRWKPHEIPVWSLRYVRFWLVKILIRANPMVLFAGSPLYVLYLRALGAKIGRGVTIFSGTVPVCTDLLTIGDRTVIRKDSSFTCYRAHAGRIQLGAVTLGKDVVVGEAAVLDIETSMGDGAQLGHASCLNAGGAIPDGQRWHGSPAQRTDVDYRAVQPARCGTSRRLFYSLAQLLNAVLAGSLAIAVVLTLLKEVPWLTGIIGPGHHTLTSWTFYLDVLLISLVLFMTGVLIGLAFVVTVPRVLNLVLKPDTVYPLYGFHYWIQRMIARLTNSRFFTFLFGDSSAIVHYLQALGYDLSRVEQTGSNFGMAVKHETPYLSSVGSGTMVSDGLSFVNADFSSTSFRVSRASIGPRNFLGNNIVYPSQGKTGENCLLATKVMVPIDGDVREGVGLLGSPPFEIPRSVQRDSTFDAFTSGDELSRRLSAKNRHNAVTIGLFLLVRWLFFFVVTLLAMVTADVFYLFGELALASAMVLIYLISVAYFVFVDRAVTRFRALQPKFCSVYDLAFWQQERFWKVPAMMYIQAFNGTPFKNTIWRLLGVRIGRRVFDDGCWLTERTLVSIGDDCTLNAGNTIQSHSLEDGVFKSDHITIGVGCTVGINSFIHYGVTMGDGAVLDADAFLMKGEEIAPYARWRGNPAHEVRPAHQSRELHPTDPAAATQFTTMASATTPTSAAKATSLAVTAASDINRRSAITIVGEVPPIVVWKFGGTSVGDHDRLRAVAERLVAAQRQGHRVVAVLSAMDKSTDELYERAYRVSALPPQRELDALLSVGESISCALASMAVHELGARAVSLTGAQAGIVTDDQYGNARVRAVHPHRIIEALDDKAIVLVTGFQGVSAGGDVTTLGRGGSDASAIALAAALGVSECDIFTDVPGVFTADPRLVPDALLLRSLRHEEMLEMAEAGAAVLQPRAVELAAAHGIDIHLRSSFSAEAGTWIRKGSATFDGSDVVGIVHRRYESLYSARGASAAAIASSGLQPRGGAVGVIVRDRDEVRFTAPGIADAEVTAALSAIGADVEVHDDLGTVSVVSSGIARKPAITARVLTALEAADIKPHLVTTTPGRVSAHISAELVDHAVQLLHDVFFIRPTEDTGCTVASRWFEVVSNERGPRKATTLTG